MEHDENGAMPRFIYYFMKKNASILLVLVLIITGLITANQYFNNGFNYHWPLNKELTYSIDYKSEGESYGSKLASALSVVGDQKVIIALTGQLKVRNQGVYQDGYLLSMTLMPDTFVYEYSYSGNKQSTPSAELNFFVQWNEQNGFSDIYIEDTPVREYEHLIKDILNIIQLKVPSNKLITWKSIHETIFAKENVSYHYSTSFFSGFMEGCLSKEYDLTNTRLLVSGVVETCFDNQNIVKGISGFKKEQYVDAGKIVSDNSKHISLKLLSEINLEEVVSVDLTNFLTRNVQGTYAKKRLEKKQDEQIVAGRTLEKIMQPLQLEKAIEISDQANIFSRIAAYLRLYPEKTADIGAIWQQYEVTDFQFSLISTALRSSDTPESRAVLQQYVDVQKVGPAKSQVLLNLAMMTPESDTIKKFWGMYDEAESVNEAAHALMGLGIMASKAEDGSELKNNITSRITTEYNHASSLEEKRNLIMTMANTRDSVFTEILVTEIEENEALKLSVLKSFKDIRNETSKNVLLSFTGADNAQVRYTSYKSLATYEIDSILLNRYEKAIYNEPKRHIVEIVLVNMSKQKDNASVKAIARDYLNECPSVDLCKLAKAIL